MTTLEPSSPVLDYGQPPPRTAGRRVLAVLSYVAIVLSLAGMGAWIGTRLGPIRWVTSALATVSPSGSPSATQTPQQTAQQQLADVAALRSKPATDFVLQDLASRGHSRAAASDAGAWLTEQLGIEPIANSRVIQIFTKSDSPKLASDVLNAYLTYGASASNPAPPLGLLAPPFPPVPQKSRAWVIGGFTSGAVCGIVGVMLWRRGRRGVRVERKEAPSR